jgi:general secretion pathway protein D
MGGFNQGFGGFNIFGQQARTNQRRTSTQRRQTGRSAPIDGAGASRAGVRGTLTATGFVPDPDAATDAADPDAPDSRQFIFGGPFGGFGGRGNFQTPQFGRGRTGSFVNLLQLRNNVGVVADPASNSLILTTTPDNLEELKKIIETLDVVPSQVMIEVIIAEANVEDTQKLGFQFDVKGVGKLFGALINQTGSNNFPINNTGTTSTNIDGGIVPGAQYGIQSSNYSALVQALQTDSRIRILSTPKVFTSNNQQGTIDITTRVPYVTSAYSGGLNLGQSVNYDYLDLGITLDVTPRITADGMVTIDVVATSSELLGFDTMQSSVDSDGRSTSIQAPRYSNRETNTSVTTRDGEIVAIGGLMRESGGMSTHKVPLLGDIPLLGHLFRSTTKTTSKTELMLFLVPRVVTGESSARAVTQRAAAAVGKDVPQLLKNEPGLRQGAGPQSERPGSKPADPPASKP